MRRPRHHLLLLLPVGMLMASILSDTVDLSYGKVAFATMAYWFLSAGIVAELVTAMFAVQTRRIGLWEGAGNALFAALFIWSWLLREAGQPPSLDAMVLSTLGVVIMLVTFWLTGPSLV